MKYCLLCFALFLGHGTCAQAIEEDAGVSTMMRQYVAYNQGHQEVRGWRIQILVTTDRRLMDRTKSTFERNYPDYDLDFTHENPFYHLKTGAFVTQQSARPFLSKMREEFSGAFIVSDQITLSEVLKYQ